VRTGAFGARGAPYESIGSQPHRAKHRTVGCAMRTGTFGARGAPYELHWHSDRITQSTAP